jgi:transglutaminase-like putative cysteine protease
MMFDKGDSIEPTYYCDFDHPALKEQAAFLARDAEDAYQVALRTFIWVRDRVRFGFDLVRVRASDTLKKGYGACFNKSLLLTSLLRANGIPAMFCSAPVSRWFMKPYIGMQCLLINNPFHHCLVKTQIDGEWLFAEPTLDQKTYEAFYRPLGVDWGIDWSREHQDRLYKEHLMGEPVIHDDLDKAISRNVGNTILPAPIALALSNRINQRAWKRLGDPIDG